MFVIVVAKIPFLGYLGKIPNFPHFPHFWHFWHFGVFWGILPFSLFSLFSLFSPFSPFLLKLSFLAILAISQFLLFWLFGEIGENRQIVIVWWNGEKWCFLGFCGNWWFLWIWKNTKKVKKCEKQWFFSKYEICCFLLLLEIFYLLHIPVK